MSTGNFVTVSEYSEENVNLLVSKLFADGQEPDEPTTIRLNELGRLCYGLNTSQAYLNRVEMIAQMRDLWEAIEGAIGPGKAPGKRGGGKTKSRKMSFFDVMKLLTGYCKDSVRRILRISDNIDPDVKTQCLGTPLANEMNLLHRMTYVEINDQRRIVECATDLTTVKQLLDEIVPAKKRDTCAPADPIQVRITLGSSFAIPPEFKRPVLRPVAMDGDGVVVDIADTVEPQECSSDKANSDDGVAAPQNRDEDSTPPPSDVGRAPATTYMDATGITPPTVTLKEVEPLPKFAANDSLKQYIFDRVPECEAIEALTIPRDHHVSDLFPRVGGKALVEVFAESRSEGAAAMELLGYARVLPEKKLPAYAEIYLEYGHEDEPSHLAVGQTNMRREVVSAVSCIFIGEGSLVSHTPGKYSSAWARPKSTQAVAA